MSRYILLIEDDDDLAALLGRLLWEELDGIDVVTVRQADEALEVIRRSPPVLGLIDMMLPFECGIEIAAIIRDAGYERVPLIAMTGSSFMAEIARESGLFGAVLEKPLEIDDLLLRVSELEIGDVGAGVLLGQAGE